MAIYFLVVQHVGVLLFKNWVFFFLEEPLDWAISVVISMITELGFRSYCSWLPNYVTLHFSTGTCCSTQDPVPFYWDMMTSYQPGVAERTQNLEEGKMGLGPLFQHMFAQCSWISWIFIDLSRAQVSSWNSLFLLIPALDHFWLSSTIILLYFLQQIFPKYDIYSFLF